MKLTSTVGNKEYCLACKQGVLDIFGTQSFHASDWSRSTACKDLNFNNLYFTKIFQVSLLCQWYLTKLVGEIFLGTSGTSESCHESVMFWGFPVNQVIQDNQDNHDNQYNHDNQDNHHNNNNHDNHDNQVSLAHLWVLFGVITYVASC